MEKEFTFYNNEYVIIEIIFQIFEFVQKENYFFNKSFLSFIYISNKIFLFHYAEINHERKFNAKNILNN